MQRRSLCQVKRPISRKERWSVITHTFHNIKDLNNSLGTHWLQRTNPNMKVSVPWVNLVTQTSMPPYKKKNVPEEKQLVPDQRRGKYKWGLEKQDVLVCHRESGPITMESCQKHTAGRGSTGQIKGNSWIKITTTMDDNPMNKTKLHEPKLI